MRQFSEAVDGISDACRGLGIPVVSGNVSLYNETDGVSVIPTPMIGIVGKMEDVRHVSHAIHEKSCDVWLLEAQKDATFLPLQWKEATQIDTGLSDFAPAHPDKEKETIQFLTESRRVLSHQLVRVSDLADLQLPSLRHLVLNSFSRRTRMCSSDGSGWPRVTELIW